MTHTFNSDMACKVGLHAAVVYKILCDRSSGKVRMARMPVFIMTRFLPFLSELEIITAARALQEHGYIAAIDYMNNSDFRVLAWRIENNDVSFC